MEVPLETFFHKIVMMRNNLRVLEQKVNASDNSLTQQELTWQQDHITRACYGSLTHVQYPIKNKESQFAFRIQTSVAGFAPRSKTDSFAQRVFVSEQNDQVNENA